MLRKIKRGSTARTIRVFVVDTSTSVPTPKTGLTSASSGLVCKYIRSGDSAATTVTLSAGTVGSWSSGGFAEVVGIPGVYELGLPNAALAVGDSTVVYCGGVTDTLSQPVMIELDSVDYQDADAFGLSRIDAAVTTRLAPAVAGRTVAVDASGEVTAATVSDKTGYSLSSSQAFSTTGSVGSVVGAVASVAGSVTVGAYAAGQSPASLILASPANKIASDASGYVTATVADKTGFSLSATGLNLISVTDPGAPGSWSTFPKMLLGHVYQTSHKQTLASGTITVFATDGSTPLYTRTATDDGTTQTLGGLL